MRIEKLTNERLDEVAVLEKECFVHPWSRQSLESEINNANSLFYAAEENGEVIGYVGMSVVVDEGYIFNVAVKGDFRRRGVGSALINHLVTFGKKNNMSFLTLEVRQSNKNAISLYSKFGFIKVGERKNYYSNPTEDAILMTHYF